MRGVCWRFRESDGEGRARGAPLRALPQKRTSMFFIVSSSCSLVSCSPPLPPPLPPPPPPPPGRPSSAAVRCSSRSAAPPSAPGEASFCLAACSSLRAAARARTNSRSGARGCFCFVLSLGLGVWGLKDERKACARKSAALGRRRSFCPQARARAPLAIPRQRYSSAQCFSGPHQPFIHRPRLTWPAKERRRCWRYRERHAAPSAPAPSASATLARRSSPTAPLIVLRRRCLGPAPRDWVARRIGRKRACGRRRRRSKTGKKVVLAVAFCLGCVRACARRE